MQKRFIPDDMNAALESMVSTALVRHARLATTQRFQAPQTGYRVILPAKQAPTPRQEHPRARLVQQDSIQSLPLSQIAHVAQLVITQRKQVQQALKRVILPAERASIQRQGHPRARLVL